MPGVQGSSRSVVVRHCCPTPGCGHVTIVETTDTLLHCHWDGEGGGQDLLPGADLPSSGSEFCRSHLPTRRHRILLEYKEKPGV